MDGVTVEFAGLKALDRVSLTLSNAARSSG